MSFSLDRVIKALLFGASGPLSAKDIQRIFTKYHEQDDLPLEEVPVVEEEGEEGALEQPFLEAEGMPTSEVPSLVTSAQIRESIERIATELEDRNEVYRLVERHNGFLFVSAPNVGEWIRLLRDEPRPVKLSQSALETLAVIAYRQPVIRSEIEKIRGVSVDSALSRLLEREFIQVVGRADLPGRPLLYGTTEQFLEFVDVRSIDELPASDVLSPRQIDDWLHDVSNPRGMTERDMGLPEGERPKDLDESEGEGLAEGSELNGEESVSEESLNGNEIDGEAFDGGLEDDGIEDKEASSA